MERVDLLALADFNLVARYGGFGRAARETGRPKATLSRRVADLERELAVRLFERGTHTLKLTEEGRALSERTGMLLAELDETAAAIASGGPVPRGRLRVSAPLLFSQAAMGKLAARFALKYREVRLEVSSEDRTVDMVEEGYDLVIRVNPDPDESLVGRIFLRDRLVVVAPHDLQKPKGKSPVPAIARVGGPAETTSTWEMTARGRAKRIEVEPVLRLSSLFAIRDATQAGVGISRLPLSLVSRDIASGRLAHWGDVEGPEIALWALYPSRRLLSARVAAFLEFLKEAFPRGTPDELAAYVD